ncbi:MAG: hypothetical protein K2K97_04530, partial [Muribaculaceae bacterium]|nr:hypothetical protein [Muribaculaceae bacterium]
MILKDRIALSLRILSECGFQQCMHSNDEDVVFHAAAMIGSRLSERDNHILMNRNALPIHWYSDPSRSDCKTNSAFKKGFAKIVEYIECDYNITPGRMLKLLDLFSCGQYSQVRKSLESNLILS